MKKITKTNPHLVTLIKELKKLSTKEKVKLWKRIAEELSKSTRNKREVNLEKLDKVTKENETIIIPGKLLGSGNINHKVNVAAFQFSETAKTKVNAMSIEELMKQNPKAKGVRIIC